MKNTDVPPIGRYIDPLTDFGFKRIFGSTSHKNLLIAFLNALFKNQRVIGDLVYNPQESHGPAKHYRKAVFDITCTGTNGETFIIEIQRADQKFFKDRALFYVASQLHEQGIKGRKHWDFELQEMYFIGIADFTFTESIPGEWLHQVQLIEAANGRVFYNKLEFIFLELPNFDCAVEVLKTDLDRWLYLLRNMGKMEEIPLTLRGETFQQMFDIAAVANLKKEEYMLYRKDVLDRWTEYAVLETAKEKAIAEGLEQGREQGLEQGRVQGLEQGLEQGLAKGIEEGAERKSQEVVKKMLNAGRFTIREVADFAGVTVSFVNKIAQLLKEKK
ncbi:Rpn family recombination-promoting nuclease/putative transposase [Niabella hirudinis]|uniref:Rpn family recombination-promoting nuclease/putative transposase n=1 Tax=Niabella hirudinis TaxID=1285929 RepID=UPI003EB9F82B